MNRRKITAEVSNEHGTGLAILDLAPGESGAAFVLIDGVPVAQLLAWNHAEWCETFVGNGAIRGGPGSWVGTVKVAVDQLGESLWSNVSMFDGTGVADFFGRPSLPLDPAASRRRDELVRASAVRPDFLPTLKKATGRWVPKLKTPGYPLPSSEKSALDWSRIAFDPAPNRHQTGSPDAAMFMVPEAALLCAIAVDRDPFTALEGPELQKVEELTDALFGHVGQQCRRPVFFFDGDPAKGEKPRLFRAADWPQLVMGEFGPARLWNASTDWGRWSFQGAAAARGAWTGLELEHLTVDTLASAWAIFNSGFGMMALELTLEALSTHPHVRDVKPLNNQRVWAWSVKALTLGAAVYPFAEKKLAWFRGLQHLATGYSRSQFTTPVLAAMPNPADPRHVYPLVDELRDWATHRGLSPLNEMPGYDGLVVLRQMALDKWNEDKNNAKNEQAFFTADLDLRKAIVAWFGEIRGTSEIVAIYTTWSHCETWQLAACATAALGCERALGVGAVAGMRQAAIHAIACVIQEGSKDSGTFFESFAARIPNRKRDYDGGHNKFGVALWSAGGVGAMIPLAGDDAQPKLVKCAMAVLQDNPYAVPSERSFYTVLLGAVAEIGLPVE